MAITETERVARGRARRIEIEQRIGTGVAHRAWLARWQRVAECHGDAYHDGELTWWRCVFCERYFDWEGMELLSGGQQACERCAEGWMQRCRASVPSDAVENNEQPAPPGALSVA